MQVCNQNDVEKNIYDTCVYVDKFVDYLEKIKFCALKLTQPSFCG